MFIFSYSDSLSGDHVSPSLSCDASIGSPLPFSAACPPDPTSSVLLSRAERLRQVLAARHKAHPSQAPPSDSARSSNMMIMISDRSPAAPAAAEDTGLSFNSRRVRSAPITRSPSSFVAPAPRPSSSLQIYHHSSASTPVAFFSPPFPSSLIHPSYLQSPSLLLASSVYSHGSSTPPPRLLSRHNEQRERAASVRRSLSSGDSHDGRARNAAQAHHPRMPISAWEQ